MRKKKTTAVDPATRQQYLEDKIRELFREIIGGLKLSEIVLPEKLQGQERINFAKYCHETYHSQFFKPLLEAIFYPLIMHAAERATDMTELTFMRATPNGVMLVAEMFQKWANVYDEDYSPDQKSKFDPTKSFESIKDETT